MASTRDPELVAIVNAIGGVDTQLRLLIKRKKTMRAESSEIDKTIRAFHRVAGYLSIEGQRLCAEKRRVSKARRKAK